MTTNTQPKKLSAISTAIDRAKGTLTVSFPRIGETLTVDISRLDSDIIEQATFHGLKQKLVDAAAIARNPDTGRAATDQDKLDAVREVFDRITSDAPSWNAIREGGGNVGGLLLSALVRHYEGRKTLEELRTWLEGKTAEEKLALRKNPKIAAHILDIQAERAKAGDIDSDGLLDELDD